MRRVWVVLCAIGLIMILAFSKYQDKREEEESENRSV